MEPVGREFLCHVTLAGSDGQTLIASTLERGLGPGSDVRLRFDPLRRCWEIDGIYD